MQTQTLEEAKTQGFFVYSSATGIQKKYPNQEVLDAFNHWIITNQLPAIRVFPSKSHLTAFIMLDLVFFPLTVSQPDVAQSYLIETGVFANLPNNGSDCRSKVMPLERALQVAAHLARLYGVTGFLEPPNSQKPFTF